jgi:hypothetical protein
MTQQFSLVFDQIAEKYTRHQLYCVSVEQKQENVFFSFLSISFSSSLGTEAEATRCAKAKRKREVSGERART